MKQTVEVWHSPTLCGCVLERTRTWDFIRGDTLDPLWVRHLEEQGQYDKVTTTYTVISRCLGHDHLKTPADLAAELLNFGQNRHKVGCGCALVYWFDKRLIPNHVHVPLEHPVHTKRCPAHAHLTGAREHHTSVIAEYQAINAALLKIVAALKVSPESVGFHFDADRKLVIDHDSVGVTADTLKQILGG